LKGILNREEFKNELKSIYIHLQKEADARKYLDQKGDDNYLEETCLNFKKITHILEI
jgi:hypothetical protein